MCCFAIICAGLDFLWLVVWILWTGFGFGLVDVIQRLALCFGWIALCFGWVCGYWFLVGFSLGFALVFYCKFGELVILGT